MQTTSGMALGSGAASCTGRSLPCKLKQIHQFRRTSRRSVHSTYVPLPSNASTAEDVALNLRSILSDVSQSAVGVLRPVSLPEVRDTSIEIVSDGCKITVEKSGHFVTSTELVSPASTAEGWFASGQLSLPEGCLSSTCNMYMTEKRGLDAGLLSATVVWEVEGISVAALTVRLAASVSGQHAWCKVSLKISINV